MALIATWLPILLLALYTGYAIRKHRDPERVCTELLAGCVLSVFLTCLKLTDKTRIDAVIEGIKIVFQVLQGDSGDFLELAKAPNAPLALVRTLCILTPVMTAGTVFVLIFRRFPRPVLIPWKCHIFSALDEHATELAKSIAETEEARFIFLRTSREALSADTLQALAGLRFSCYPYGEIQLLQWHPSLRLRPLCMYFLTENSEENFDRMDEFLAKAHRFFKFGKKTVLRELFLLSETSSAPMLIDHLRKTYSRLPATELRLLDRYRAASLHLMKTAPLYDARRDGNARVLMLGMGQVGRSLYRTMASMGVMGQGKLSFHLCDQNMNHIHDILKQQYPELEKDLTVTPKQFDAEGSKLEALLEKNVFDCIVVALGDDERNLRVTAALCRHFRKAYWSGALSVLPRICVNLEDETKARSTERIYLRSGSKGWEPKVTVFGTDREVFSAEVLLPRGLWLAARKLHAKINNDKEPGPDWCEYERRSSIAAVAHGAAHIVSVLPNGQTGLFDHNYPRLAEGSLETLIRAEHQRWINYVRSEGMTQADEGIWKKYAPQLKTHVDIQGQLSPCLVPVDALAKLYEDLKPYLSNKSLTFRQRDELVVRNADLFALLWEMADPAVELRELRK